MGEMIDLNRRHGCVLAGVYCESYEEAQTMLHALEHALRVTATPAKRTRLEKWRKDIMKTMARSQTENWMGWEREDN